MVRHWDTYLNPKLREQLFVAHVDMANVSRIIGIGSALNVLRGTELETPVAPFGDNTAYSFSPDGKQIAFSARVPQHEAAWNTNLDIFIVPTNGSEAPFSISAYNIGADSCPIYSPNGSFLLWLQMKVHFIFSIL